MVKIEFKEPKALQCEESAFIEFPYKFNLVKAMKNLPGHVRYWHADIKVWEVRGDKVPEFINQIPENTEIHMTGMIFHKPKPKPKALPAGFEFKTNPYDHQIDGFWYGIDNHKFLLGDEQGLGKTKQIIDIAIARRKIFGYNHCLIIACVNGLKWNWYEEIKTHSNEIGYILGQKVTKKGTLKIGGNKDKINDLKNLPSNYFLITNIESFRDKEIADEIHDLIVEEQIDMVAVDEVHKCKNPASQQGKGLLKILKAHSIIPMTGTPLITRPLDIYMPLKLTGNEPHSFYQFKKHYCVMGGYGGREVVGYKNMEELEERLQDIMLRRLKKDVIDLPPKIRTTEYVEMTKKQELIYKEVKRDIQMNLIDQIKTAPNPIAQFIRLRQATGYPGILSSSVTESAKMDRMMDLVEEFLADNCKIIIYSQWTKITDRIRELLAKERINHVYITGQNSGEYNHEQENIFQTNPDCMVCVGTIGALGTGFTLTAATVEIFVDEPWSAKEKEQAEDRAHRIGTTEALRIITLITKDTIDERISEVVYKKGVMADSLVDGKVGRIDASIVDYLLS